MPTLTPSAAALIALACGGWLAAALWATLRGLSRSRAASGRMGEGVRAEALLAAAPAVPLLVSKEGRLHGPDRTAFLLGLDSLPGYLADLGTALGEAGLGALSQSVAAAAASGAGFAQAVRPEGGSRVLELRGGPAPAPWPQGTVLIWILDSTESEGRLAALDARSARLAAALDALSGLIEAAPFPMWHRGPDLALAMVNSAYVEAVEGEDSAQRRRRRYRADRHARRGDGSGRCGARERRRPRPDSPGDDRRRAADPSGRRGPARRGGGRRLCDRRRGPRAGARRPRPIRPRPARHARPALGRSRPVRPRPGADLLQPAFRPLFSLKADFLADRPEFNRLLDAMREDGHLPEVRDYPDWKKEHGRWFTGGLAAEEEDWLLPRGQHLRVVAQPLPDGGLLLIFEDRTEQLRLASARDTLLRVRTATFDNLFEAIGVFASDGRLHLWNNRFRELWEFDETKLADHPRIDSLRRSSPASSRTRSMPAWSASWCEARRSSASSAAAMSPSSTAASSSSPRCRCPTATRSSPCSTSPPAGPSRRRFGSAPPRSRKRTG
jgi:PAS domain-containing protein